MSSINPYARAEIVASDDSIDRILNDSMLRAAVKESPAPTPIMSEISPSSQGDFETESQS